MASFPDEEGGGDYPLFPSPTQPEELESLQNTQSMFPPSNDLTTDWVQWMQWDEPDENKSPDCLDILDPHPDQMNNTATTSSFDPSTTPFDFSFDAPISLTHARNPSTTSLASNSMLAEPLFSPQLGGQGINNFPSSNAMPTQLIQPQQASSTTILSAGSSPISPIGRKRKSSEETSPSNTRSASPNASKSLPSKKRSHNVIEKRYRANLNDKIAELRDSVPSLRLIYQQRHGDDSARKGAEDDEFLASSANKLNKASILSKATEYIKHLEVRNKRLEEENLALKNRFRQLEKIQEQNLTNYQSTGSESSPGACTVSTDSVTGLSPVFSHADEFSPESTPNPLFPAEGLLKVPDAFKRLRPSGPQPHYADSLQYHQPQQYDSPSPTMTITSGNRRFVGFPNKFMIGTLAGIMVIGGFEHHRDPDATEKELFSIPFHYLASFYQFLRTHFYFLKANSWQIRALAQFMLTSGFLIACAFFVFLYLFYSRPRSPRGSSKLRNIRSNRLGASSTEFRQDAWLTSIQTVGVPRHNFFPEWFAVTSRCCEYVVRCLLGWKLYSFLTGISEDDERGRVKAWDIALDAQLTGGDAEVSRGRLVLTIFSAGTLPRSPARMMLKALHCRVLLWRVGDAGSLTFKISNYVAGVLANYQWELAQRMHETLPKDHEDALPSHLAYLLTKECDAVFTDAIIQRACNMIWNRPTQEATDGEDSLLDVVVDDTVVRSPLDALAAWWSSRALQETLLKSLALVSISNPVKRRRCFENKLRMALNSAPGTSTAYTRAAAVKALFCDEGRVENINAVLSALPSIRKQTSSGATNFLDSSVPSSARVEICIAVRCAMIAAILRGQVGDGDSEPSSSHFSLSNAVELFNKLAVDETELTLLGFASFYHLLHITATDERLFPCTSLSSSYTSSSSEKSTSEYNVDGGEQSEHLPIPDLARIAADLIFWVRNAYNPISSGLNAGIMEKVVEDCVDLCRNAGVDIDVQKIQRIKTRQRKPSVTFSELPETDISSVSESDSDTNSRETSNEFSRRRPRRESTFSNDTGYASIGSEEQKAGESSISPPSKDSIIATTLLPN
ncbi:hypothetical protein FQN57_006266 [Myotisia sp. PD_48]|nr:hypothetical protein FQN57_006266 [Myotisia sp. PD_48]